MLRGLAVAAMLSFSFAPGAFADLGGKGTAYAPGAGGTAGESVRGPIARSVSAEGFVAGGDYGGYEATTEARSVPFWSGRSPGDFRHDDTPTKSQRIGTN